MSQFKPHLILVEDDHELAHFYAEVAFENGWQVTRCSTGYELIDTLKVDPGPAMLLIDVHLPEMDGIEVIDHISHLASSLRIRFVTGGEAAYIIAARMIADARSLNTGRNLFKPVSAEDLSTLLHSEEMELQRLAACA
ncbi:response regulator [Poseidonocella sedimentorum]|uniref:Two-component system, cell cycle response regulator CpdR n=1 Tax=Poseidonocella sedimentorum TaxID=871652 RepID=A0A1I6DTC4_9RHOB|nr:response regulator [Poseidonocella sedimentorum]SFR08558.1 two-component system, cell cycle response regulator CpdR [Poseidonocella sedimentorum]